jgi:hypothetical protein
VNRAGLASPNERRNSSETTGETQQLRPEALNVYEDGGSTFDRSVERIKWQLVIGEREWIDNLTFQVNSIIAWIFATGMSCVSTPNRSVRTLRIGNRFVSQRRDLSSATSQIDCVATILMSYVHRTNSGA